MRLINRMADRLLTAVVPEISAGASASRCCSRNGQSFGRECSCNDGRLIEQTCTYTCNCGVTCGPCRVTGIPCP